MTFSDSASLNFFSWMALIGAIVVIVGVVLEGSEHSVKLRGEFKWRRRIAKSFGNKTRTAILLWGKWVKPMIFPFEAIGFSILIIGLAIELFGTFKAEIIQSRENAELESTNFGLALQIEQLRSTNLWLESKMEPRIISEIQRENFITSCSGLPRVPIKVIIGMADPETQHYAKEIRKMLDAAGFASDAGPHKDGIVVFPNIFIEPQNDEDFTNLNFGNIIIIKNDTNILIYNGGIFFPQNRITQMGNGGFGIKTNDSAVTALLMEKPFKDAQIPVEIKLNNDSILQSGEGAIYVPTRFE